MAEPSEASLERAKKFRGRWCPHARARIEWTECDRCLALLLDEARREALEEAEEACERLAEEAHGAEEKDYSATGYQWWKGRCQMGHDCVEAIRALL